MCAVHGCSNPPRHKTTVSFINCPPMDVELCDECWAKLNGRQSYSMGWTNIALVKKENFHKIVDGLISHLKK